jgi:hypothetical protein
MSLISLTGKPRKNIATATVTMPKVTQALRDARGTLLVANRENPKTLGDFGFVVDDSPPGQSED